jgi:hypothetical protein
VIVFRRDKVEGRYPIEIIRADPTDKNDKMTYPGGCDGRAAAGLKAPGGVGPAPL